MEKKIRPEVIIESAEPVTPSKKRPGRLNASSSIQHGYIPKAMRPANSTLTKLEEEEYIERASMEEKRNGLSLTHPMVMIAAALGLGFLISHYGVGLFKPALDKVVEAAEDIVDESTSK